MLFQLLEMKIMKIIIFFQYKQYGKGFEKLFEELDISVAHETKKIINNN